MNKNTNKQISIPIQLTRNKTIHFKPFEARTIILMSVAWFVLCYTAILTGVLYNAVDGLYSGYSSEKIMTLVKLLLAPGAVGLAYGNALLAKGSQSLFWVRFIIGSIVILAISVWLVFPLSYLIQF
jgi:hypothetical protein